MFFQFFVGG